MRLRRQLESRASNTVLLCVQPPEWELKIERSTSIGAVYPGMAAVWACAAARDPAELPQFVTRRHCSASAYAKPVSRLHTGHVGEPSEPVRAGRKQHLDACPPLLSSLLVLPHEGAVAQERLAWNATSHQWFNLAISSPTILTGS
jgi:hypothetical protein